MDFVCDDWCLRVEFVSACRIDLSRRPRRTVRRGLMSDCNDSIAIRTEKNKSVRVTEKKRPLTSQEKLVWTDPNVGWYYGYYDHDVMAATSPRKIWDQLFWSMQFLRHPCENIGRYVVEWIELSDVIKPGLSVGSPSGLGAMPRFYVWYHTYQRVCMDNAIRYD